MVCNFIAMDDNTYLQTHQITYLEHGEERLYAEVIQVIPARGTCWARPLAMLTASQLTPLADGLTGKAAIPHPILHDLRYASDLLLPMSLFRPALDVDVLPWIGQIYATGDQAIVSDETTPKIIYAQHRLNQFIRTLCQAYPEQFQVNTRGDVHRVSPYPGSDQGASF